MGRTGPESEAELAARGRAAWPDLEVEPVAFAGYVASRAAEAGVAAGQLCVEDLYLACACAGGDDRAVEAFVRHVLPHVEAAVLSAGAGAADLEEVKGRVLDALFVAGDRPRGIAGYAGRGRLRSWVRSIAVRTAVRYLDGERRRAGPHDILDALGAADSDPELEHLRVRFGDAFRDAFAAALAGLSPRERNLLRQHYLDELTVDELGALYRVHRATAARWVAAAREVVFDSTRARLIESLGVAGSDLDSIMRLLKSDLDVSIARWLAASRS
ncbi:MAG TPA: sigma-70 family RNA polymerase sigma factor [Kofleriaceae bacterium]|nr:sigma-70 family RNA polymerase sigma factor [Kofleriaceae bacterium]